MDEIIKYLSSLGGWPLAFAIVLAFFFWMLGDLEKGTGSQKTILSWIRHNTGGTRYRDGLVRCLNWLDRQLSRHETIPPSNSSAIAWSYGLLSFSLSLAIGYPIFTLMVQWAMVDSGAVGGIHLLPEHAPLSLRYGLMGALILGAGLLIYRVLVGTRAPWWATALASLIFAGVSYLVAQNLGVTLAAALAFATVAGAAFAVTFLFEGELAVAFAMSFALGFASGTYFAPVLLGSAIALSLIGMGVKSLGARTQRRTLVLLLWYLVGCITVLVAVYVSPVLHSTRGQDDPAAIVFFLAVLPMINGGLDFASFGMTRFLLRRGATTNLIKSACLDLLFALLLLVVLVIAVIGVLTYVHPPGTRALLNLDQIYTNLCTETDATWWATAMVLTTLVPTLLHISLGLLSLFALYPKPLRVWLARLLAAGGDGDKVAGRLGRLVLTIVLALSALLPFWVLSWALHLLPNLKATVVLFASNINCF